MNETSERIGARAREAHAGPSESAAKHLGVSEAKATFSALIEGVQHRGERYVIERHGKPAAALVSLEELDRLESQRRARQGMTGGLGLIGMWRGILTDADIDDMVDAIYADRENDVPREVDTSDWGV